MAVEEVPVFIGFGVSPIVGLILVSCVVSASSVVPTLSIGFGVSSMRVCPPVDPSSIPCVDIVECITPILVVLEVSDKDIGFGVSPV